VDVGRGVVSCLVVGAALAVAAVAQTSSDEELEQLRALGYLDFSETAPSAAQSGVTVLDAARSQPGYNLYASRPLRRAELIDAHGRVVRSWERGERGHWSRVRLLSDGDLLVVGSDEANPRGGRVDDEARFLMRLGWGGELRWRRELAAHHDVTLAPDGRITVLVSEDRTIPELGLEAEVRDEGVVFVTPEGEVQRRQLFVEMFSARPDVFSFQPVRTRTLGERLFVDLLHANSIEWLDDAALAARNPLFARGRLLVSMRNQDSVAILDLEEREVVWAWGQGEIRGPHDASLLPNGHVLLFDNRLGEGWSRVVELDPIARQIVWQYRAPTPSDFYTRSRGSAQRLANGNTLVAESDEGRAFEVTSAGEIVWEFWNPYRDAEGRPATIIRMDRYPESFVAPLLAGR
jgi:hypothetical protein